MAKIDPNRVNNVFDAYLMYQSETECPMHYHRWSLVTCLGAMLRRNFFLQHGPFTVYPNLYTMLIGDPGARKSTAIKQAKKLLLDAGFTNIAADKTSKEKFLADLEGDNTDGSNDDPADAGTEGPLGRISPKASAETLLDLEIIPKDTEPRCCLIAADEFNEFVGINNIEFLSTLGNLWDYEGVFQSRTRNAKSISIPDPTISILSGNTHAGFQLAFPPEASGQGFLSRILLVYGESTGRKIAFPPVPDPDDYRFLLTMFGEINRVCFGPATMTKEAEDALTYIYENWRKLDDSRLASYGNRRFTQLLKLCVIHAAGRVSTEVSLEDVYLANTLLTYTEHNMSKALGEYGKNKNWDVAAEILRCLDAAIDEGHLGMTSQELFKAIRTNISDPRDFQKVCEMLLATEKIKHSEVKGVKMYHPVKEQREVRQEGMYNLELLWELGI